MKEREIERWWRWWGGGKWVVGEEERDCKRWVWKCWSSWRFQPLLFLSTLGVRVLMREFSLPEIFVAERHTHRAHQLVNSSTFFSVSEWVSVRACFVFCVCLSKAQKGSTLLRAFSIYFFQWIYPKRKAKEEGKEIFFYLGGQWCGRSRSSSILVVYLIISLSHCPMLLFFFLKGWF